MLDVDALVRQVEVGSVLAVIHRRGPYRICRLVLKADAVEREEVRDREFLVALDEIPAERAQFTGAHPRVVLARIAEIERGAPAGLRGTQRTP